MFQSCSMSAENESAPANETATSREDEMFQSCSMSAENESAPGEGSEPAQCEPAPAEAQPPLEEPPEALVAKGQGNEHFKAQRYEEAIECYTQALELSPKGHPNTAIYYANRGACRLMLGENDATVADCTSALEVQTDYVKALQRRSKAYDALGKKQAAFKDLEKVKEHDASLVQSREFSRLQRESKAEAEKEQEEMMGKLKDMGNTLLGKIGLSLDNFKTEQREDGSYNISFSQ
jgi:tetratricopeptide (TPR) repeat protein